MPPEVRIEHRYPEALAFLRQHGAEALVILDDLLAHAEQRGNRLVVQASVREIAGRRWPTPRPVTPTRGGRWTAPSCSSTALPTPEASMSP